MQDECAVPVPGKRGSDPWDMGPNATGEVSGLASNEELVHSPTTAAATDTCEEDVIPVKTPGTFQQPFTHIVQ